MFKSIQVMRGIAALMIVAYHVTGAFHHSEYAETSNHFLASGVDIFFVISGFVMVTSTAGRNMDFLRFMSARVTRIVPLYWLATAAQIALATIVRHQSPSVAEIAASLFFIPYTNPGNGQPVPILGSG